MGDTGGLHVGNCASNITSISTARRGYTDRTEAAIETLVGTVTVRIPLGIDAATLQMVLRALRIITVPILMMLRMCFAPRRSAPHIFVF